MKDLRPVLLGLLFAAAMTGCSKKDDTPSGIIGVKPMSSILLDMQEAEVYNESYIDTVYRFEDREKRLKTFYAQILSIHRVSRKEFLSSYSFYESRPDLMQKVYTRMQAEIDRKKSHADSVANIAEMRSTAIRRRDELIKKFKSYQLPYRRYADSIPNQTKVFRPEGLDWVGKAGN